jgi:peroxiredoxin family protein/TusA-related sulfurtransferase
MLGQMGFASVKNLSGGYKTWHAAIQKQSNEELFDYDSLVKEKSFKAAENASVSCVKAAEDEVAADNGKYTGCDVSDCGKPAGYIVDACGLQCPGPVMKVHDIIKNMEYGDLLEVKATDPAFGQDIKSWCERTGNRLVSIKNENRIFTALIKKQKEHTEVSAVKPKNEKTMVVFSGDLDKAIATFIIANGAAAMGRKVTLFFTFWGLNVLRKTDKVSIKKDFISKMFGFMMPRGSKKLGLSRMNMAGAGPRLIRHLMKKKNVSSLEELINQAKANGVRLVACNMSMDLMGISREELIDGVEIGGVATMLGSAEESDMSLFI